MATQKKDRVRKTIDSTDLNFLLLNKLIKTSGVLEHKWRASLKLHYC